MNDYTVPAILAFLSGAVIGWISCGMSIKEDCAKIGGFVAGSAVYTCEKKK